VLVAFGISTKMKNGVKNISYKKYIINRISGCYVCIALNSINKIGVDNKKALVNCVKDLYTHASIGQA